MYLPDYVQFCISRLEHSGYATYAVGGCVRDALLGLMPHDYDLCTAATPAQTATVFADCALVRSGEKHGTIGVVTAGGVVEITTFRTEGSYADSRHPDFVRFVDQVELDLARRDFTVNAMAYHPEWGVVDLFGGQADLNNRIIRCVGEADKRFNEDALRMLRGLRFAARLGFAIEENTAAAIHRNKELLVHVAAERIREELTGLLCGSCVEPILRQYHDVISVPIPELAPQAGFRQHNYHHCHDIWGHTIAAISATPNSPALRWAALLHDVGKPARFSVDDNGVGHFYGHASESAKIAAAVTNRLRFDNATRDMICFLVEQHHLFTEVSGSIVRRAMLRFGREKLEQLLLLLRADTLGHAPRCLYHLDDIRCIADIMAAIPDFTVKDLAVNGKDLMELGYSGPQIGHALNLLLEAVVFSGIPNEKHTLLNYLTQD